MDEAQIVELGKGQPVAYALNESRDDELAAGIAWYLPVPVTEAVVPLREDNPDILDVGVTGHGVLTKHSKVEAFRPVRLSDEDSEALLQARPGDQFNLSGDEILRFNALKPSLNGRPGSNLRSAVEHGYHEMLFTRFAAYRHAGTKAIAPYARDNNLAAKPSVELYQAAKESALLARYLPALHDAWLNYPKALPSGTDETFRWVVKNVENRPAAILRHRINTGWNGGILVLTREFYAPHSYNSSQWITGCLPYRDGTVVFQQVRSFTDQVSGAASSFKHLIGRELLKNKMLKAFERLCDGLARCRATRR